MEVHVKSKYEVGRLGQLKGKNQSKKSWDKREKRECQDEENKPGIRSQKWKGIKTNMLNRVGSFKTTAVFLFGYDYYDYKLKLTILN